MIVNRSVLKPLALISVLIVALTLLFLQTQEVDVSEKNRVIFRIQDLIYQDALVNESVLKSRIGQFSNYDPLTRYRQRILEHLRWFKNAHSGVYGAYGQDLDEAIDETTKHFVEKLQLTERFKSHNGLLKNSLHYLPLAIKNSLKNDDDTMYQSDLDTLLREVLLYNSSLSDRNKDNATNLIQKIKATGNQRLIMLAMHADTAVRELSNLQGYVDALFSAPTKQGIDRIHQLYNRYSTAELARASTYRTAMYALAVVLLFYALNLLLVLRKTMSSLKQSLSELAFQKHALDEHAIVAVMDAGGDISYINDKFSQISQFSKDDIVGKNLSSIGIGNDSTPFFVQVKDTLAEGRSWKGETHGTKQDGGNYWVDATVVPFMDESNTPLTYVALLTDITARKKAETEQEIASKELKLAASVFSNSPMAIMITDSGGVILRVNDAFCTITGFSLSEAVGQNSRILKSDVHESYFFKKMWKKLTGTGQWEGEIWNRWKDGSTYPVWSNITAIHDSLGHTSHYISSFSDISEKKKVEDRIFYLAHYDALTTLPNRAFFLESVEKARVQRVGTKAKIAVLFVDLDNFKMVNDTMGHARGDALLRDVAEKLLSCVRETDIVARLGGDEFIIALLDIPSLNKVEDISRRIVDLTRQSLNFDDKEIVVSSSIGISVLPDHASSIEALINNADTAMYQAKTKGKSKYLFFNESMTIASSERFDIENDLRLALLNQQFELYYQPQVIAESGEIFAVEALMRWKHPVHGFIPPDKFIPELERNGLIIEVGKWVLQQAASQLNEWKKSGYSIRMAVNISSRQLEDGHLPGYIRKLLVAESIEPHELELELTESCLMKNPVYAISLLNELNDIGIYLALDDFGTGYSSLSYLKKVPIQTLKIDKSFVRDILTDQNDRAIATTIIAMAKSLELKVIAEGVETEEQLKFLQQSRCDYIQGYYFSKPVSAGELELVLTENRTSILRSAPALRSVS